MHVIVELCWLWLRVIGCYFESFYRLFVPNRKNIDGKIVLITGAGRGIGRALALEFLKHGCRLVLWDIIKEVHDVAKEIQQRGGEAKANICDITDGDAVHKIANQVRSEVGNVDILVNNAGIMIGGRVMDIDEKTIRKTFEVNTFAPMRLTKEFLPYMFDVNSGHILNISSQAGLQGVAYLTEYCASKHAILGFSKAMATEFRQQGGCNIQITAVCPLFVNTKLVSGIADRLKARRRFGRDLQPEEVAEIAVDGLRKNQLIVEIPKGIGYMAFMQYFLPQKALDMYIDFLDCGFVPAK